MRTWLVGLALIFPAMVCAGDDRAVAEIATQAERAFRQGVESKTRLLDAGKHFGASADLCLELHRRGVRSPALYRNLANAAALADRWPEAGWACHVGLKLDPNDRELREQLAFVRGKTLYPASGKGQPEPDNWPLWLHRPGMLELVVGAAVFYLFAWIGAAFAFVRPSFRMCLATACTGLIAGASGITLWHERECAELDRRSPLVIVAENTPLYRGNGTSYPHHPDVPLLPRGMEVRQQHRRGNWLQVRLTSGEIGWLPVQRVLIVEP